MRLVISSLIIVSATVISGCASTSPNLRAQVDELTALSAKQDAEIKRLSGIATKCSAGNVATDLKSDAADLATSAWIAVSTTVADSYKSLSAAASDCYTKHHSDIHSVDDAMAVAKACWGDSTASK